ncbi:putative membrane protein, partial [Plasmodium reichenowi]
MILMGLNSDYNARINLKIKFIVKSIVKVITKHLLLISILNLIISLCYNYIINRDNQLNIVAHLLRGTFVSSIPSCLTLSLLIFFKEHSLNNYKYNEWNILNIFCVILTFYS